MAKIILAGGGNKNQSKHLDQLLVKWIPKDKPLLYIPIAMPEKKHSYDECYKWIMSIFKPIGFDNIHLLTNLIGISLKKLKNYGGIYIGGGNTYDILDSIRVAGFAKKLNNYIEGGNPVYGGSAGACIMGKNILISSDNNKTNLSNYEGLDIIHGHSIYCHYNISHDSTIKNYMNKYNISVVAIPEDSGLVLDNERIYAYGKHGITLFNKKGKRFYPNHTLLLSSKF